MSHSALALRFAAIDYYLFSFAHHFIFASSLFRAICADYFRYSLRIATPSAADAISFSFQAIYFACFDAAIFYFLRFAARYFLRFIRFDFAIYCGFRQLFAAFSLLFSSCAIIIALLLQLLLMIFATCFEAFHAVFSASIFMPLTDAYFQLMRQTLRRCASRQRHADFFFRAVAAFHYAACASFSFRCHFRFSL
jgi:hypothetical protein